MTPVKDPAESIVVTFDFSSEMTAIDSATTSVFVLADGVDPAVAAMLVGAPQISGTKVLQRVAAGVHGNNYKLRCEAAHGDDVLVRADIMPVRTA